MGTVKIQTYNETLMNIANYENLTQLKNLLKCYESLGNLRFRGDTVANSIWLDLTSALQSDVMTEVQHQCVIGYFIERMSYQQLADEFKRDRSTIRHNVNGGVKRIQKHLVGGTSNVNSGGNDDNEQKGPRTASERNTQIARCNTSEQEESGIPVLDGTSNQEQGETRSDSQ